ncbi:MAG: hypothetical protein J1E43_06460 [Christensenellaceae bacterium]|nr:hypothetical protein [Christensenellaceae bacterium]
MTETAALRRELLGCLIGLARTCSNNPPTDETEGLLLAGLHAADEAVPMEPDRLWALISRVRADKAAVSPNCANCASPCGKNDDYDLARLDAADPAIRAVKERILRGLMACGHQGRMSKLVFDALFALAEDWDEQTLGWYADELEKTT